MSEFIGGPPIYSHPWGSLEKIVHVEDIMTLPSVIPRLKTE